MSDQDDEPDIIISTMRNHDDGMDHHHRLMASTMDQTINLISSMETSRRMDKDP